MPEEELSTWFSNVVPTALKKQAKKERRQSTKRIQRRRQSVHEHQIPFPPAPQMHTVLPPWSWRWLLWTACGVCGQTSNLLLLTHHASPAQAQYLMTTKSPVCIFHKHMNVPPPPPPDLGCRRKGGGELCISAFIFLFKKILLHDEYICALLLISDFNLKTVIVIDIFKLVWHL